MSYTKVMTFRNHHAHIFIGNPESSKDIVLEYLSDEGITPDTSDFHLYELSIFTIDDARELKRLVSQKAKQEGNLVVVVFTENFSHPAQHALLKTLEEPHAGVIIIFVTPREHVLLPTLRSRVMTHYLSPTELVSPIDVKLFEHASIPKKLSLIDDYLKKIKDDEALHETSRRDALYFLHAYESYLHQNFKVAQKQKEFTAIFFAKEYLHDQGSSVKQLLEYVALIKGDAV
jgi:DNA polymerase III delta prime subunit